MLRQNATRALIFRLAVIGVLIGVLAGCARTLTTAGGTDGNTLFGDGSRDSIGAVGMDCDSDGSPSASPPQFVALPADAVLVAARRCLYEASLVPGEGEWTMRVEQQATSGLEALASALRLPSEPRAGQACLAIAYAPIVITVTDTAGRKIHPSVPETACGAPLEEAVAAITALPWTTVSTTRGRQIRTELEVTSGCSGSWKPMIPLIAAEGSGTQTAAVETSPKSMQVCRYGLDPDPADVIMLNDGTPYHLGVLVAASTLDAASGGELLSALSKAPRAGACGQPEQPFAVIFPTDRGGPYVAVELGGCYRAVFDPENYARQLDAATVSRLLG